MPHEIEKNIQDILRNIGSKASEVGRDSREIKLLAVTKTVDEKRIIEAMEAGITMLGENYVQETSRKRAVLDSCNQSVAWHMIGHLQTRKAALAVRLFAMIHSLDSLDLAWELDKKAKAAGTIVKVLIQVNTGEETTKSGVSPRETLGLVRAVAPLENLSVQGLMTVPPWFDDPEKTRPFFKLLRELRDEIAQSDFPGIHMQELSMGMTEDYLVAIEEGATIVRIGRGIFGQRTR